MCQSPSCIVDGAFPQIKVIYEPVVSCQYDSVLS